MDEETRKRIETQDKKISELQNEMEQTHGGLSFKKTKWLFIIFTILPLIGLAIAIPWFISFYTNLVNF